MTMIYTVTPTTSDISQRLRKAGWTFASSGAVDRGDGYALMRRPVRDLRAVDGILDLLARQHVTGWTGPL